MADNLPLGSAKVEFVGDASKLKVAADQAKKMVDDVKRSEADAAASSAADRTMEWASAEAARKRIEAVQQSVADPLADEVDRQDEAFRKTRQSAQTYGDSINSVADAAWRLKGQVLAVTGLFGGFIAGVVGAVQAIPALVEKLTEARTAFKQLAEAQQEQLIGAAKGAYGDRSREVQGRDAIDNATLAAKLAINALAAEKNLSDKQVAELESRVDRLAALEEKSLQESFRRREQMRARQIARDLQAAADYERQFGVQVRAEQERRDSQLAEGSYVRTVAQRRANEIAQDENPELAKLEAEVADLEEKKRKAVGEYARTQLQAEIDAVKEGNALRREAILNAQYLKENLEVADHQQQLRRIREQAEAWQRSMLDALNAFRQQQIAQFDTASIAFDTSRIESLLEQLVNKREL